MKIFVSWSGTLSQKVACTLRDWIPCVLQYARPYVSSEDIDKGTRWSLDIAKELNDSTFGLLCVTADNQSAPWLNFEAGALSKAIEKSFVTPFLLNLKASDLTNGPLIQFQAATFNREEVRKVIESINSKSGDNERVDGTTVKRTFDMWWPELEKGLAGILQAEPHPAKIAPVPSRQERMLEELLDLSRSQQRHLSSPESLLPPDYLEWAFHRSGRAPKNHPFGQTFHSELLDLIEVIADIEVSEKQAEAAKIADKIHRLYHSNSKKGPIRPRSIRLAGVDGVSSKETEK